MTPQAEEMSRQIDALPEGIPDVIDALMSLFAVMLKNSETVTIGALSRGIGLAMADGHEMAGVYLGMVSVALAETKLRRPMTDEPVAETWEMRESESDAASEIASLAAINADLVATLRAIVAHQDLMGGKMAKMSSVRRMAMRAIEKATGE